MGGFDLSEDRMSVLLHTYSARLGVHVVIYINKLFSAEDQPDFLQVTRLGLFLLVFAVCCYGRSKHIDRVQWYVKHIDAKAIAACEFFEGEI